MKTLRIIIFIVVMSQSFISIAPAAGEFQDWLQKGKERREKRQALRRERRSLKQSPPLNEHHSAGRTFHQKIIHDGIERNYILYIPSSYEKYVSTPLVLSLHGRGGRGQTSVNVGWNKHADTYGFIGVYPDGLDKRWNDGRLDLKYKNQSIDDAGFLKKIIAEVSHTYNVDQKRIYAVGISNGGHMAFRLACEYPQYVSAMATVAALMPESIADQCQTSKPIPLLMIHGSNDTIIPWAGGPLGKGRGYRGVNLSGEETLRHWAKTNQCRLRHTETLLPDRDPQDGTRVVQIKYKDCQEDVVLLKINGGGHTWPGEKPPPNFLEGIIGKTSKDISGFDRIFNFLQLTTQYSNKDSDVNWETPPPPQSFSLRDKVKYCSHSNYPQSNCLYKRTLKHHGMTRTYEVFIPPQYKTAQSHALILAFHGGGGSIKSIKKQSDLIPHAQKNGYVVVFPKSAKSHDGGARWNNGTRINEPQKQSTADDVDFIRVLLNKLESHLNIDTKRIYATGISSGGHFTYRLGCDLSNRIAAIAPVAGIVIDEGCVPDRPISVIHFHGTEDRWIKMEGGLNDETLPPRLRNYEEWRSVEDSIAFFKNRNHCPRHAQRKYYGNNSFCETYGLCNQQTEVTLCTAVGGGHTWPGGQYPGGIIILNYYKKQVGEISRDFNANDLMWEFFQKHPLK